MIQDSDSDACNAVLGLINRGRLDEAFQKCRALAEAGVTCAQVRLGWMYHSATGTPKDWLEAESWYRRAIAANSPESEFYLASLYRAKLEPQSALEWFEKSAQHGYAPAMYHLGRLHLFGAEGAALDEEKAYRCFEEAARAGHLFARRNIARRMASGRRGMGQIPRGILLLIGTGWSVMKVGWKHPDSEQFLRL
jgi:uncharacterized protein